MENTIHQVTMESEFRICPECGYKDGFHTMLKESDTEIKWLFICPACHQIFDIGQTLPLKQ